MGYRMFNANITIFNKVYDPKTRSDKYVRKVLKGVHVEKTHTIQKDDSKVIVNDSLFVSIPFSDEYTSPKKFQETKEGYTIQNRDVIVVDIVEKDIESLKDLKDMDDIYTVNSVEVIDYSKGLNHIEVYASRLLLIKLILRALMRF